MNNWEQTYQSVVGLIRRLASDRPLSRRDVVIPFLVDLSASGWSRNDIYHMLVNARAALLDEMPEELGDFLLDVLDGLIGNCSSVDVIRLAGEPTDATEFLEYVYSRAWLRP